MPDEPTPSPVPATEADSAASQMKPSPAAPTPSGPAELVRFDNVSKSFGAGPTAKLAVQDVSFVVHDLPNTGELVAIVGPSGCGKSTVLRMLAGLLPHHPPTTGEVLAFGKRITGPSAERGMVDQKYSLMPHLTVAENIAFGLKLRGVASSERRARAHEWAQKVGLDGSEDKYPSELSGGMQQRVSIAATLILEPKILLMDEPFGALDPKIRMQMQELLVKLWREQQSTVFLVTHSMEEAVYLGDRVLRMAAKPGRLVEKLHLPRPDEPPDVMRQRPWFNTLTQDLLRRLETDAPASGELPGVEKWR
jgi:NitT/TauT family transport system ATP-binding protein